MKKMLWAVKIGDEDWQGQVITERAEQIEAAKVWATANGFNRFRVASFYDNEKPDFEKCVNL